LQPASGARTADQRCLCGLDEAFLNSLIT
jgi:hypothetical protein